MNKAIELITQYDHCAMPLGSDGTPLEYIRGLRDAFMEHDTWGGWSEQHGGFWLIASWEGAMRVYRDDKTFCNQTPVIPSFNFPSGKPDLLAGTDGEVHSQYRRLVQPWFTPARVATLADGIREDANELIDQISGSSADLSVQFGALIPERLAGRLFGLTNDEVEQFGPWADAIAHSTTYDRPDAEVQLDDLRAWFADYLADRRGRPRDDVMSDLIHNGMVDGRRLNDAELLDYFSVLMLGALENSALLLSDAVWFLAQHPDLRQQFLRDPSMVAPAVDEFLRYFSVATGTSRVATVDVEVEGVKIRSGDRVLPCGPVANRDPRRFSDPDAFIPGRSPNTHASLSNGPHRCLGAHLVRVEVATALAVLLERIPEFELARDKAPRWVFGPGHGLRSVPVTWPAS